MTDEQFKELIYQLKEIAKGASGSWIEYELSILNFILLLFLLFKKMG